MAAIAALILFCKNANAQNIDTTRSKAFGYQWTQAELDSFPQKTNCPSVYLNVYKTTYDATTGTTSFTDGTLEELDTIFGYDKKDWYYITKIAIRDDNGTIQERNEWAGVRGRGNATWDIPNIKKPLRIKFPKKTALLTTKDADGNIVNNNANAKSWTLLANYYDATQVHNGMTYELTSYIGMEFCPAAVYVDMYVNGRFMGTYQISDQVQVADKRVPIIEDVGYFFEANSGKRSGFLEDPYMKISYGNGDVYVNIKSPDPDPTYVQTVSSWRDVPPVTSDPKFDALKAHLEKVSQLAFSGPYNVAENWRKYVDMASAVNAFIGNDVTGDYDGVVANNYAYMTDIYSLIKFGPIWDFDLAWGAKVNGTDMTEKHFWEGESYGFGYIIKQVYNNDPYFMKALYERWQEVYKDGELITYLTGRAKYWITHNYWTDYYNYLSTDQGGAGWSLNKGWADGASGSYQNVDQAYDDLMQFITKHITWLNSEYKAKYEAMGCADLPEIQEPNLEGEFVDAGMNTFWGYGEHAYYFYGSSSTFTEGATLTLVTTTISFDINYGQNSTLYKHTSEGWTTSEEDGYYTYSRELTADDVEKIKSNGYKIAILVWNNGECKEVTLNGGSEGCDHDYTNCTYAVLGDGTYRRICTKCGSPEIDGEPYYQFTIYPESTTERTMMGTTWRPEDIGTDAQGNALYPNAIAKVKVTTDVAANIQDGVNIVNVTGEQYCQNLVITDGHPYYCDKKFTAIKSTYSREVKNDWGTIILPYKYQQASNATASFYHLGAVNQSSDGRITLTLTSINPDIDGNASAYTPVFFKRKNKSATITVEGENITVKKSTADKSSSTVADWTLYGTMEKADITEDNTYYVANNTFYQNEGSFELNPFRAYIKYDGLDMPAKTISISDTDDEDIASSVQTVSTDDCLAIFLDNGQITVGTPADMNVNITTISGSLIKSAAMTKGSTVTVNVPAGIYLVNGVKVLVK